MYGAIGQKHVTRYPGMLPRDFGLEIVHLALSQHPDGMMKKSQITLFVNIKVKVRSGCVSDRVRTKRTYNTTDNQLKMIFRKKSVIFDV